VADSPQDILAVIPVRGGSKRLPGKNIRPIAGRPLLAYSVLTARACPRIGRVIVSSDDPDILRVAAEWGGEPLRRPDELAGDTAPTIAAMRHALEVVRGQGTAVRHVALFQATCPLRRVADVERCIDEYLAAGADSALTVNELHLKAGRRGANGWYLPQYKVGVRKQDLEPLYQENGAFYLTKADLVAQGTLLGPKTLMLRMPPEAGLASIDVEFDFQVTEALYHQFGYEVEFGALARRQLGRAA
jgi:CMP-N-acetylneuraminic acid synthetase